MMEYHIYSGYENIISSRIKADIMLIFFRRKITSKKHKKSKIDHSQ
ncbi:hypothetical protein HMPREF1569_5169 [Klebsiella oxytoca OK-1]|nr:hypothetical protein HMPREF1569_5169 [Klebsiella oxytoca OK-1]